MIRVVLDANVLASGIVGIRLAQSLPGELLRLWKRHVFTLVVSDVILTETERTLTKPYFRRVLSPAQASSALTMIRLKAERLPLTVPVIDKATHPEDDLILSTAISTKARYLVTGDVQLQALRRYRGVSIVSPRSFLAIVSETGASQAY